MKAEQIPVKLIPDDPKAIGDCVAKSTRAMVGADSIMDDGSLINGSPNLVIAEAAKQREIPFYVVCETTKFSALRLGGGLGTVARRGV